MGSIDVPDSPGRVSFKATNTAWSKYSDPIPNLFVHLISNINRAIGKEINLVDFIKLFEDIWPLFKLDRLEILQEFNDVVYVSFTFPVVEAILVFIDFVLKCKLGPELVKKVFEKEFGVDLSLDKPRKLSKQLKILIWANG